MIDDGHVHQRVLASFVERGRAPTLDELAAELAVSRDEAMAALRRLDADHGLVLHPNTSEIWIAHPFSNSPTGVWVQQSPASASTAVKGWWAPCLWCGLGVAVLAAPDATIHARYGGEAEPVVLSVERGVRVSPSVHVHIPIPVRHAWDNVIHWCATMQPFRSANDAVAWSARHGIPTGDVVPVDRLLELARAWYGTHLDRSWHKWTNDEARAIFTRLGLAHPTWHLPERTGRF